MEQVKPPYIEDCEHKDHEVEFPLCEEDDFTSLCIIKDSDHLENEDVEDKLIGMFFQ